MREYIPYYDDFKSIVKVIYEAHKELPLSKPETHLKSLYDTLSNIPSTLSLEQIDIEQELAYNWLLYLKKYNKEQASISLRWYLISLSTWAIRDWYISLMRMPAQVELIEPTSLPYASCFRLDLNFLLHGSSIKPLNLLTPYERYLLYLRFKDDRTLLEIANTVQRTKKTIVYTMKAILEKLRRCERFMR